MVYIGLVDGGVMTPEFKQCVEAAGGTQKQLAEKLGVTEQAVGKWKDKKIPVVRVLQIEAALGIERSLFRPDIYPPEESKQAA
jgi:DNA-binding transcriptional regulator YdaS (Cro superfamily)